MLSSNASAAAPSGLTDLPVLLSSKISSPRSLTRPDIASLSLERNWPAGPRRPGRRPAVDDCGAEAIIAVEGCRRLKCTQPHPPAHSRRLLSVGGFLLGAPRATKQFRSAECDPYRHLPHVEKR